MKTADNISQKTSEETKKNIQESEKERNSQKGGEQIKSNPDNISDPDVSSGVC
ncbi:MAG: hypothetical protein LIP01_07110 [Tannerellaceae bacterium]|nr:hypothetical protein [Tannerellaceae bacterium]